MEIVQRAGFKTAQGEVRRHDVTIVLGYAAFAISCWQYIWCFVVRNGTW